MKSRRLIEYEAWMEDWFRKHPLPPMSKKARRRIAKNVAAEPQIIARRSGAACGRGTS